MLPPQRITTDLEARETATMPHHQLLVRRIVFEPDVKCVVPRGMQRGHSSPAPEQELVKRHMVRIAEYDGVGRVMRCRMAGIRSCANSTRCW